MSEYYISTIRDTFFFSFWKVWVGEEIFQLAKCYITEVQKSHDTFLKGSCKFLKISISKVVLDVGVLHKYNLWQFFKLRSQKVEKVVSGIGFWKNVFIISGFSSYAPRVKSNESC